MIAEKKVVFVGGPDDGREIHLSDHEYIWTDGIPDHIAIYTRSERVRPCYRRCGDRYCFVGYLKDRPA